MNGGAVVLLERLAFPWLRYTATSSSTRASTPRGSFSTRTAARRCCWNVEALAFVESFDVNGGAVVLLERRLSPVGRLRHCQPPLGLQLSDGVLRRERRRKGAAGASTLSSLQAHLLWQDLCIAETTCTGSEGQEFLGTRRSIPEWSMKSTESQWGSMACWLTGPVTGRRNWVFSCRLGFRRSPRPLFVQGQDARPRLP